MKKLVSDKKTTSIFLRGLPNKLKEELEKLKIEGNFRTYADLLEAMVREIRK